MTSIFQSKTKRNVNEETMISGGGVGTRRNMFIMQHRHVIT